MKNFMDYYFGPLPREFCVYFYILAIIAAIFFVCSLLSLIYISIFYFKKITGMVLMNYILVLINTMLMYIANRLLHTMCVKSI
jgi:hypothetical protein